MFRSREICGFVSVTLRFIWSLKLPDDLPDGEEGRRQKRPNISWLLLFSIACSCRLFECFWLDRNTYRAFLKGEVNVFFKGSLWNLCVVLKPVVFKLKLANVAFGLSLKKGLYKEIHNPAALNILNILNRSYTGLHWPTQMGKCNFSNDQ